VAVSAPLTYGCPGATRPGQEVWDGTPQRFRRHEAVTVLGRGERVWRTAAEAVLRWEVKTRSGFTLAPQDPATVPRPAAPPQRGAARGAQTAAREPRVELGEDRIVLARMGPVTVREPVRIVAVVDTASRAGFAYGTRAGHPVCGEEAWVVSRDAEGTVRLTLRSLTAPAPGPQRLLFPGALLLQPFYRRRYLRALSGC
jgi:uncharacterized protein (UPF0548 family)